MIKHDGNGGWWASGDVRRRDLPPHLYVTGLLCLEEHPQTGAFVCTRSAGHGLRHAAGAGPVIVAVWR